MKEYVAETLIRRRAHLAASVCVPWELDEINKSANKNLGQKSLHGDEAKEEKIFKESFVAVLLQFLSASGNSYNLCAENRKRNRILYSKLSSLSLFKKEIRCRS